MKIKNIVLTFLPHKLVILLKKIRYKNSLLKFGKEEEPDIEILAHIVKPGDRVIDIGANVGWYAKILSGLVKVEGEVCCIEPIPDTYKLLVYLVKKLKLGNVKCFNMAMSDHRGSAVMEVPEYKNGGVNYYRAQIIPNTSANDGSGALALLERHEIGVDTLDNFFSDKAERIDFIKCDVEGHELAVLRGSTKLIQKNYPAWYIEVSGNPDDENDEAYALFEIFKEHGYTCWWFDGRYLHKREKDTNSVNYYFLKEKHVDLIPEKYYLSNNMDL